MRTHMSTHARSGAPVFFWMAVLLVAIVVSGFSVLAFSRPGGPLETPVYLHFHGAVFLGWYVLLAVQARLIGAGQAALHKRMGLASLALALAIVVVGYFVVRFALLKPGKMIAGRPAIMGCVFPVWDIIDFTIAYALGFAARANSAVHKRFLLSAAILMIDPAMARLILTPGFPGSLSMVFVTALFGAMFGYVLIRLQRPHWASVFGLGLYAAAMTFKSNVEGFG